MEFFFSSFSSHALALVFLALCHSLSPLRFGVSTTQHRCVNEQMVLRHLYAVICSCVVVCMCLFAITAHVNKINKQKFSFGRYGERAFQSFLSF